MKKIVWLPSYPKSGNTWTRTFLTNLLDKDGKDEDVINELTAPISSSRGWIDEYLFIESSEFTQDEVEAFLPLAMKQMVKDIEKPPFFFKVHDAYIQTINNEPMFPAEVSIGAIYIVRNPLDVAVSFAHHNNEAVDMTIEKMADNNYVLADNTHTIKQQVRQKLLTWSGHVHSWLQQKEIPVLMVRYEDMIAEPLNTFRKVVEFSGLSFTDEKISLALGKSSFDKLKTIEDKNGFREKSMLAKSFFRKGKAGSWRESLTPEQAQRIIADHREVMEQLGYLDADGNPVY